MKIRSANRVGVRVTQWFWVGVCLWSLWHVVVTKAAGMAGLPLCMASILIILLDEELFRRRMELLCNAEVYNGLSNTVVELCWRTMKSAPTDGTLIDVVVGKENCKLYQVYRWRDCWVVNNTDGAILPGEPRCWRMIPTISEEDIELLTKQQDEYEKAGEGTVAGRF